MDNKKTKQKVEKAAEVQVPMLPAKKVEPPKLESTPIKAWKDGDGKLKLETNFAANKDIRDVIGSKDTDLASNILASSAAAIESTILSSDKGTNSLNVVLQSFNDFSPKDVVESRLVAQAVVAFQHGMEMVRKGAGQQGIRQLEALTNLGIKFMRVHNETIEALSRYRRGGEQKVTVTHIAEKMAVVNNYGCQGGGDTQQNKGDSPCQQYAEPKQEPMEISPVASQPWEMENAGCMEVNLQVQKVNRVAGR